MPFLWHKIPELNIFIRQTNFSFIILWMLFLQSTPSNVIKNIFMLLYYIYNFFLLFPFSLQIHQLLQENDQYEYHFPHISPLLPTPFNSISFAPAAAGLFTSIALW